MDSHDGSQAVDSSVHQYQEDTGGVVQQKKVLLAAPRGYCAGVDRAVETVERALEKYGAPIYVRKHIVHNKYVVETLAARGAIFVEETQEAPPGAHLVFSAHGVSPMVRAEALALGQRTVDATCPLVTKVHNEVKRCVRDGYHIALIGHKGHEEVEGTAGEAPDAVTLIDGIEGARHAPEELASKKLIWLSQTTLSVDETADIVRVLRERFPQMEDPPSGDICYATHNRQSAVKAIAERCDVMIVVGSRTSSNSKRLVEVAMKSGCPQAYLVDYARQIDAEWLRGATCVGLTSGASVPEILVRDVLSLLAEHGFTSVEEVSTVKESTVFALPRDVRPQDKTKKR